jgi:hypothetical protein
MKVKTRIWLKSNHAKAAKDRYKLLKGGGEAGSGFVTWFLLLAFS